jgi:hypothetical protein
VCCSLTDHQEENFVALVTQRATQSASGARRALGVQPDEVPAVVDRI